MAFGEEFSVAAAREPHGLAREHPAHLRELEAESIHIFREFAGASGEPGDALFDRQGFDRPAASGAEGVLSRPVALPAASHRHDVEVSRDDYVSRRDRAPFRIDLRVYTNPEGIRRHINPFDYDSVFYNQIMKTDALKQALSKENSTRPSAERGAMKNGPAPRSGFFPFADPARPGTRNGNVRSSGISITASLRPAKASGCSRSRTGPSSMSGPTSSREAIRCRAALFRGHAPDGGARRRADRRGRRTFSFSRG